MTNIMELADEYANSFARYELESYFGTSNKYTENCKIEVEEAKATLELSINGLQADADRYRAMRTASVMQDKAFISELAKHDPRTAEQFDAAIDAAKGSSK